VNESRRRGHYIAPVNPCIGNHRDSPVAPVAYSDFVRLTEAEYPVSLLLPLSRLRNVMLFSWAVVMFKHGLG